MRSPALSRKFARWMLPLAVSAGLVVFLAPAVSYHFVSIGELHSQADIYAEQIAGKVRMAAEQEPYLWRYNTGKILMSTASYRSQKDISEVTVFGCEEDIIFGSRELDLGTGRSLGPSGSASVRVGNQVIARVKVAMDASAHHSKCVWVAIIFFVLGSFLGVVLFLFPTRVVRRQASLLEKTVTDLTRAERELSESNTELSYRVQQAVDEVHQISKRLVHVQEEERVRIARDLHDGVGQAVTALRISLKLATGKPDGKELHMAEASGLAEEILSEIRAAVFALRPAELAEGGLELGLRDCVERFELRTGVPASLRIVGSLKKVPEQIGMLVFRVLQESLTNVAKHAEASEVGVGLVVEAGRMVLEVEDDGCGFDVDAVKTGSGLKGIGERVSFARGNWELESKLSSGTRLVCEIPIEDEG